LSVVRLRLPFLLLIYLIFPCEMVLITGRLLDQSYRTKLSIFVSAIERCEYGEVNAIIKGNTVDIRERCIHRTTAAALIPKGTKMPIVYDSKSMPTNCNGKLTDAKMTGDTITFSVECTPEMVKEVEAEAVYASGAQGTICIRGPCEGGYYGSGWSMFGDSGNRWIGFAVACGILLFLVMIVSVVLHIVLRKKAKKEASSRDDNDLVDVELSSRKTNQTSTSDTNSDKKQ
uniref:Uncharacterized protein n=1 Tax=Parascaris univalens TaxID=6257 RepID=A0A915BGV9_PARUN